MAAIAIDYEQKIRDCREDGFIERLVAQSSSSLRQNQPDKGQTAIGNRFMSPAVRLNHPASETEA